jgi:hypothetical protein
MFSDFIEETGEITRDRYKGNLTTKEVDSDKPIKYLTQNYFTPNKYFAGNNPNTDIKIPEYKIDHDSVLTAQYNTRNFNDCHKKELPIVMGSLVRGQGDTDVEGEFRNSTTRVRRPCETQDDLFLNRTLGIFDEIIQPGEKVEDDYLAKDTRQYGSYLVKQR